MSNAFTIPKTNILKRTQTPQRPRFAHKCNMRQISLPGSNKGVAPGWLKRPEGDKA